VEKRQRLWVGTWHSSCLQLTMARVPTAALLLIAKSQPALMPCTQQPHSCTHGQLLHKITCSCLQYCPGPSCSYTYSCPPPSLAHTHNLLPPARPHTPFTLHVHSSPSSTTLTPACPPHTQTHSPLRAPSSPTNTNTLTPACPPHTNTLTPACALLPSRHAHAHVAQPLGLNLGLAALSVLIPVCSKGVCVCFGGEE
jgi:hypothetical protein